MTPPGLISNLAERLRRWLDLPAFRAVAKNASWLIGGNSFGAILQLVTLGVAARSIGVEGFGVLVLVTSYALFVEGLASSQSWQSLIKFGADARSRADLPGLKRVVKLCVLFDAGGVVVAAVLAFLGVTLAGELVGWPAEVRVYAQWYSLVLLFHVTGAATGVLRLFGEFRKLAAQPVLAAVIRLAGVLGLSALDGPLWAYVLLWGVSDAISQLRLMYIGFRCAKENSLGGFLAQPLGADKEVLRSHLRFLFATNLSASVQLGVKRLDVLIVGSMLGAAGAGLYRIIKMFAQIPSQITGPFYQAVFPEMARQRAEQDWFAFRTLAKRLSLSAGAVFTLFWCGYLALGSPFIDHVFGKDFSPAWLPGVYYLVGIVISGFALPLQPAVLSFGRPGLSLQAHIVSNIVYLTVMLTVIPVLGLVGAGLAFVSYYVVWSGLMLWFLYMLLRDSDSTRDRSTG